MIKRFIKRNSWALVLVVLAGCVGDLDREPFSEQTSASVYRDFGNYKHILAKLYAGLSMTGQQGPAGKKDVQGIDEGFSSYLRQYYQVQVLASDEAVIGWNDYMNWTPGNEFIGAMYARIFYQIALCNEFIRETSDDKLSERGISGANLQEAKDFRAEARFLRALSYTHAIDLFGNVPFVTENDGIGSFFPKQTTRAELFNYIESELKSLESEMKAPKTNEYGRADVAAAWTLLSKLYLNAEVYSGQAKYTEAITYSSKVIQAGYSLQPEYAHLFMADNNTSPEIIFPVTFDGLRSTTFGGMTYLVHAPVGGNMNPAAFGINGGWGGIRSTKNLVNLFPDASGNADKRGTFHTDGQKLEIAEIPTFGDGYPLIKYKNVTSAGAPGSDATGNYPDTDFPMFRLAEVYLTYAEAVLRGGSGGDQGTALGYINALRTRAYGNTNGNITSGQLTVDFMLDERGRELAWECGRRTDLIRFGKYTGSNYLWPWKGKVQDGAAVEDYRTLYPIPSSDITANPNLKQNTGY
jgi:starch-binding outer membrane protein, SusD/RagB family